MKARTAQRTTLPTPPITIDNVSTCREYHDNTYRNSDGTCVRWRSNGACQTWKTRPASFRQPVKHGMRDYGNITNANGHELHLASDCPYTQH